MVSFESLVASNLITGRGRGRPFPSVVVVVVACRAQITANTTTKEATVHAPARVIPSLTCLQTELRRPLELQKSYEDKSVNHEKCVYSFSLPVSTGV